MRILPIIALTLLAVPAAEAQVGCRGQTLSELNACVEAATPVQPGAQNSAVSPAPTSRRALGGALQPRDMRAVPPVAQPQNAPVAIGEPLPQRAQVLDAPERYGLTRDPSSEYYEIDGSVIRLNRTTREIIDIRPMAGALTGYDRLNPAAGSSDRR